MVFENILINYSKYYLILLVDKLKLQLNYYSLASLIAKIIGALFLMVFTAIYFKAIILVVYYCFQGKTKLIGATRETITGSSHLIKCGTK